ncbi:TraR/DksA family transcriptional regulator [Kineococcus gynurae]|uniref:TraR/DksA family transcriptional regulator n=1 Tax=Kineococcus gynurae TaxID=452979 RepID=A0ABV5LXS5_9ACTN
MTQTVTQAADEAAVRATTRNGPVAAGRAPSGAARRSAAVRVVEVPEAGATPVAVASAPTDVPVRAGEDAWSAAELQEVAAELHAEVTRLTDELDEAASSFSRLVSSGGEGAGDDQVDHGAATAGREHEMTIAQNARDLLEQSQRALVRLASGAYGVCETCTGPIGKARLQAFPRVTLCVGCKARTERR